MRDRTISQDGFGECQDGRSGHEESPPGPQRRGRGRDGLGMQSETVFPRTGSPELQGMGRAWDGKGWAGEVCADGTGREERGAIARDGKNWAVEVSSHTPGRRIL